MAGTHRVNLEVWKFGGASLADAAAIRKAAILIGGHAGPLVVVASALAGVTDLLLEGARQAAAGRPKDLARASRELLARHRQVVVHLLPAGRARRDLLHSVEVAVREYAELGAAVGVLGYLDARTSDLLVSRGERLSAALLAAAISRLTRRRATYVDAVNVVSTDGQHGGAAPNLPLSARRARRAIAPILAGGRIAVCPGFLGEAPDGSLTTLGRGGSDLTATLLARGLRAKSVVLWKDVAGILTADPRLVPDARFIPQLHHREAAEVAHYGAKVLHQRALIPIAGTRIVLYVRSFVNPEQPGTEVSARRSSRAYPVKALAIVHGQAIITVAGKGMVGVHGVAARTFAAVHAERLSVSTIFQASSESSIGFTVPESEAKRGVRSVRQAFREELASGLIDDVTARPGMAVIAVVGDGMAGAPGIAARVFTALASASINVVAIAQGSSERNISFAVREADAADAARRIHSAFQLSKIGGGRPTVAPRTDVVLLGFGRVGRALADQMAAPNGRPHVRVVGVLDRSGFIFQPRGLTRQRLLELAREKDRGAMLASLGGRPAAAADALTFMASHAVSRPVVVDVTSEQTDDLLHAAFGQGFDVVLANKRPLAGTWERYARLFAAAATAGRRIRYEATVGAGLPIIDTYHKLAETGDRVLRIDGCVSGTLMYIVSAVSAGKPFSQAVREAVELGYAEPDPREDLSGRDAARKALILARLIGYRGSAPVPDDLVPRPIKSAPLAEFMRRLPAFDAAWAARVAREAARGRVLRYVVTATRRAVSAKLIAVPSSSPIGSLGGTRNLVQFTTRRYRSEPLVISGPGAGAAVTAAGLLNDIYSLAGSGAVAG